MMKLFNGIYIDKFKDPFLSYNKTLKLDSNYEDEKV